MQTSIEIYDIEANVQSFGGEAWLDDTWEVKEYGIGIGDTSISGLTPKQMVDLATEMVNHLMHNGHRFEIVPDKHQDIREKLIYKGQP